MNSILASTGRYIWLALGRGQVANDAQRRYQRIMQGMVTGLAGKGVGAIVSFISVPLTVRYLGAERYGVWVTISTAMAWIALADLGVTSSLTTAISEAYAQGRRDLAQSYVASAFWALAALATFLGGVFFLVWHQVPWIRVFNVQSPQARAEVAPAVAVAFTIFVLQFPFFSIGRIYGAYQQVGIAYAWAAAGSLLGLVSLVIVTYLHGGLISLVIAVSGSVLFVSMVSAIWVFWKSKPWLVPRITAITRHSISKLSGMGSMFFVIQMSALILFQTDNLIIAHFLGARAVTPYSVTWRLFGYTTIFQLLASPSFWPAYAEAFARGDKGWVSRSFRINFVLSVGTTLVLGVPLVLFGQWMIAKWAGGEAVPTVSLLFWMAVWSIISAAMNSQATVLASCGRLKGQMAYSVAAAIVNLAASIVLVQKIGVTGAILGTIVAFAFCVIVPQAIEVKRALRGSYPLAPESA
jgi:O-antigen/teichoic acid export membrane protein